MLFSRCNILVTITVNCTRIQNIANTHFSPHPVLYKLQVSYIRVFNTKHDFPAGISLPLTRVALVFQLKRSTAAQTRRTRPTSDYTKRCILHTVFHKKFKLINQPDATVLEVYYLTFCFPQHVSGASTPIIRSLQLH
jgi:hypothetical protein